MASPSELPPDQLAVLRLLLTQGSSYSAIASSLHIQEREVQSRAVAALDSLAATEAPDAAERDATADYLLGQQDKAQEEKTRAMLAGSPAALAWARSLKAPLEEISGGSAPRLPEPGSPAARLSEDDDGLASAPDPKPTARDAAESGASQRRAGVILLGCSAAIALLAAGALIGRVTAPERGKGAGNLTPSAQPSGASPSVVALTQLRPPPGAPAPQALGQAVFATQTGRNFLALEVQRIPKPDTGLAYGVWLTGGNSQPLWIGSFKVDRRNQASVQTVIPTAPSSYTTVLITLETERTPKSPGKTYLSGAITTAGG